MSITLAAHLARVYDLLIAAYSEPRNEPDFDPVGGLYRLLSGASEQGNRQMKHFSNGRAKSRERASLLHMEESNDRIIADHQLCDRK